MATNLHNRYNGVSKAYVLMFTERSMCHRKLIGRIFLLALLPTIGGCAVSPELEPAFAEPTQDPAPAPAPDAEDPMVGVDTLLPAPDDYALQRIDSDAYPVPGYAKFLEGVKICLDPGHGGDAHKPGFKRGPTGVREAEMNLRIAKYLGDFLEHAGAEVLLTREEDVDLSYEQRAELANEWGADLFISCHHNAMSNKPSANYTTVWYHLGVDYRPSNLDLARHLCQGLLDELALPRVLGVPLKSDQLMYKTGFAVLRHARVTAALTETSFFTNPEEEQRLRDPEYNLREAYGLFLALARYAAEGLPRAEWAAPEDDRTINPESAVLEFVLDDGLRARKSWGHDRQMILTDSIAVRIDGELVPHHFTNDGYRLTVETPAELSPGMHTVSVQFQNLYKNSVLNPDFVFEVR
ncbi:MAG: N-acetylmuramoyl-L-alanine amidase [bacterium]|nr:N-acetylmuramoyl-L-alanine amidase [bacterium]